MSWIRKAFGTKTDAVAVIFIFGWVILYFEIYRFAYVRRIACDVPLGLKLAFYGALFAAALLTTCGIYRGLQEQKQKRLSPIYFLVVFLLSMGFAVACADRITLFRMLSVLIFVGDRILYHLKFKRRLRNEGINV